MVNIQKVIKQIHSDGKYDAILDIAKKTRLYFDITKIHSQPWRDHVSAKPIFKKCKTNY